MCNHFILIGVIEEIRTSTCSFILTVSRPLKNKNGSDVKDYIKIFYSYYLEDLFENHIHEGLKIGVKGRIEGDGQNLVLVAKEITFLNQRE